MLTKKIKQLIGGRRKKQKHSIPKIFFCHVPKCAGTSLSKQIWRRVYAGHDIGTFHMDLDASEVAGQIYQVDRMDIREHVLAYNLSTAGNYFGVGHVCCRPKLVDTFQGKWNFITILRDPVDRWISEYIYNTYKDGDWEKNTLSVENYLETKKAWKTSISFVRYFSSMPSDYAGDCHKFVDEAVENLKRLSVIGFVKKMDEWSLAFEKHFGYSLSVERSNISPRPEIASKIRSDGKLLKKIETLCEPDIQIYRKLLVG